MAGCEVTQDAISNTVSDVKDNLNSGLEVNEGLLCEHLKGCSAAKELPVLEETHSGTKEELQSDILVRGDGESFDSDPRFDACPVDNGSNSEQAEERLDGSASEEIPTQCRFGKLNFQYEPMRYTGAWTEFSSSSSFPNNFTKGCKWSPDGLCVLTNSEDCCLRLFNLPQAFYATDNVDWNSLPEMTPILKMAESDLVYDFCWYPLMNSMDPLSCFFVSTSRLNPVHMWDAFTGRIRATYRAFNNVDEIVSAVCLAFDPQGKSLYCGFDKAIRVFDVEVPGRHCTERLLKSQGQAGVISCIAVNPVNSQQYAVGSYLQTIALYSEPNGKQQLFLQGQTGGVTHLMFSPDGTKLYSGARKDPYIYCWDLRYPDKVLYSMMREVSTNQRIYFDIEKSGTYLMSGGTDGIASVWDLTKLAASDEVMQPIISFQAQNDCVNGVSFNPVYPMFTTCGGQRKYRELADSDQEEMDDDDMFTDKNITYDNSLTLWWAGEIADA